MVGSRLRAFTALKDDALLVLGPRRIAPVVCPASNSNSAISILTSVGFRQLTSTDYVEAVHLLRPDIVLGMADYVSHQRSSMRRMGKMADRTLIWTKQMIQGLSSVRLDGVDEEETARCKEDNDDDAAARPAFFAPILPISREEQSYYLDALEDQDECRSYISGLAIHDVTLIPQLPPSLESLPRLSLDESATTPQALLYHVSLGVDIVVTNMIGTATDDGIALDFTFPAPVAVDPESTDSPPSPSPPPSSSSSSSAAAAVHQSDDDVVTMTSIHGQALGHNLWLPHHATSLAPLSRECTCYTCRHHHRAYVHHLLIAGEMLAWVLLQVHNLHVLDLFFDGVRGGIRLGVFDAHRSAFETAYRPDLPTVTGIRPRYVYSTYPFPLFFSSLPPLTTDGTLPIPFSSIFLVRRRSH